MKKLLIIAFMLFGINGFGQESFKKKFFIPTKLGNEIFLRKDTLIMYKDMNIKEKGDIDKMYKNGVNPWWLSDSLQKLFSSKEIKRKEYEAICVANSLESLT